VLHGSPLRFVVPGDGRSRAVPSGQGSILGNCVPSETGQPAGRGQLGGADAIPPNAGVGSQAETGYAGIDRAPGGDDGCLPLAGPVTAGRRHRCRPMAPPPSAVGASRPVSSQPTPAAQEPTSPDAPPAPGVELRDGGRLPPRPSARLVARRTAGERRPGGRPPAAGICVMNPTMAAGALAARAGRPRAARPRRGRRGVARGLARGVGPRRKAAATARLRQRRAAARGLLGHLMAQLTVYFSTASGSTRSQPRSRAGDDRHARLAPAPRASRLSATRSPWRAASFRAPRSEGDHERTRRCSLERRLWRRPRSCSAPASVPACRASAASRSQRLRSRCRWAEPELLEALSTDATGLFEEHLGGDLGVMVDLQGRFQNGLRHPDADGGCRSAMRCRRPRWPSRPGQSLQRGGHGRAGR
jgi:hypothetical protein